MKSFIVLALFAAVALAAPPTYNGDEKNAETLKSENFVDVFAHKSHVETSNGIVTDAEGKLNNQGTDNEAYAVRGSYSYVAPDGQTITVNYIADENGFQPQGAHLPHA